MSENAGGDDWHFAGIAADFEDEDVEQVLVGDVAAAAYRAQGQCYATQDLCTHEHAYLSDGVVADCVIECPFHQGRFAIRTRKAPGAPVIQPLATLPLKILRGR